MAKSQQGQQAPAAQQKGAAPAQQQEHPVTKVANWVQQKQDEGLLQLPKNYHAHNALTAAYNVIQETEDKNHNPALEVCSRASIERSLRYMVIQGLNPDKQQGYFIVYGKQLSFQRSYFGDIAIAQRVDPRIADVIAQPIFDKDDFSWSIQYGRKVVEYHKPGGLNDRGALAGAYCILVDRRGDPLKTEIMSLQEIHSAWKKSKTNPFDDKGNLKPHSNHAQQPGEMAKRTVIRRCCKPIINSSDDAYLMEAVDSTEETQEIVKSEEEEHANAQVLDVSPNESISQQQTPDPDEGKDETQVYPAAEAEGPRTGPSGESPPDEAVDGAQESPADDHPDKAPKQEGEEKSQVPPPPPEPEAEPQPQEAGTGEVAGDPGPEDDDEPPF